MMKEKDINIDRIKYRLEERYESFIKEGRIPSELISEIEDYENYLNNNLRKNRFGISALAYKFGAIAASITLILFSFYQFHFSDTSSQFLFAEYDIEKTSSVELRECKPYYVLAITDEGKNCRESDESNNRESIELNIKPFDKKKPLDYKRTVSTIPKTDQLAIIPSVHHPILILPILEKKLHQLSKNKHMYKEYGMIAHIISDERDANSELHEAGRAILFKPGALISAASRFNADISSSVDIDEGVAISFFGGAVDSLIWDEGNVYYHKGNVGLGINNENPIVLEAGYPNTQVSLTMNINDKLAFYDRAIYQQNDSYDSSIRQLFDTEFRNLVDAGVGYKYEDSIALEMTAQNLFDKKYNNHPQFPTHGRRVLGKLTFTFAAEGPCDVEGDGIEDKKDGCPNVPGELNGCPDNAIALSDNPFSRRNSLSSNNYSLYVDGGIMTEDIKVAFNNALMWADSTRDNYFAIEDSDVSLTSNSIRVDIGEDGHIGKDNPIFELWSGGYPSLGLKQYGSISHNYNGDADIKINRNLSGLVAQELQKIVPSQINDFPLADYVLDFELDNAKLSFLLVNAIKDQDIAIEKHEERIAHLTEEIEKIRQKQDLFNMPLASEVVDRGYSITRLDAKLLIEIDWLLRDSSELKEKIASFRDYIFSLKKETEKK